MLSPCFTQSTVSFPACFRRGLLLLGLAALCLPGNGEAQPQALGAGGGFFDCDNDGNMDVCYVTPAGEIVLLIYDPGTKRLVNVSDTAIPSVIQKKGPGLGVLCGDVNNDGWSDLFITFSGPNHLLLNKGDNTFEIVGKPAGIVPTPEGDVMSASAAFLDYDNDGLLDLFLANYEGHANQLFHNNGINQNGLPSFEDVAPDLGMDWSPNGQSNWSLGVAVADYDNDGDSDIYVSNDYDGNDPDTGELLPGPNVLWRNNGDGTFTDVTYAAGVEDNGWAMGTTFGDYDLDGWQDIYVANFWQDSLYRNNRDGTFTNVTALVGMPAQKPGSEEEEPCTVCNGWGTAFLDFDNDGDMDIFVANGYITNGEHQIINEPNELWENVGVGSNGHIQFEEVGVAAGIADVGDGRGAAFGDYNQDGFVDIMVFNNNYVSGPGIADAPLRLLYINQKNGTYRDLGRSSGLRTEDSDSNPVPSRGDFAGNHWLQIRPVGTNSTPNGSGCRITVEAEGTKWVQDVGASSYLSTNSPYRHFGLGENTMVDRITVTFPNGVSVIKLDEDVDRRITISEDDLSPVRLLEFTVTAVEAGARLDWSYADDGDAAAFAVGRVVNEVEETLDAYLLAPGGRGEFVDHEAPRDAPVTYVLDAIYRDGNVERVGSATYRFHPTFGIRLGQNHPNPFSAGTAIPVLAAPGGQVEVRVYDARGGLVRTLRGVLPESGGSLHWDGRDSSGRPVPAGTYFYRIARTNQTLKMIRRP